MDNVLKQIIKDYCANKISLFEFENKVLEFPIIPLADDFINELLEDIATTKGEVTDEEKQDRLMTEFELKGKLKKIINED